MLTTLNTDKPRVGLVLSAGGMRGVYAHTGFIQAIQAMNFKIDAIAGCSAGAIVGGIFAANNEIKQWSKSMETLQTRQFWRPKWFSFFKKLILNHGRGCTGLSSMDDIRELCRSHLKVNYFNECAVPFSALATNIITGKKRLFDKGNLLTAMLASAAMPLLYEPVSINGELYADGGLISLSPTDAICCRHQLDILIVHHVSGSVSAAGSYSSSDVQSSWTIMDIVERSLTTQAPWYLSDSALAIKHCPCGCDAIVIVVNPDLPELNWPLTKGGMEILDLANKLSQELLQPLKESIQYNKQALLDYIL